MVSFTTTAPVSPTVTQTYDPAASATSGLAVVLSIDPASASICTLSGGTVTFTAVGACHINADQAGDADWNAATAQQVVGVGDVAAVCSDASAPVVMNVAKTGSAACTDLEADPLTYAIATDASHGSAAIDAAGTWTYTPALDYRGTDTFTFTANDGVLDSSAATITITVTNAVIDARNDLVPFVRPLDATVINVLSNDSPGLGEAGQPLRITAVANGARGRVTTDGATATYDPTGCSTGADTFTYTVTDGQYSATKTVYVTIARPGSNGLSSYPVTDVPALGFITNSTIASTVPARLSWCGVTRSGYSVRSYTVGQSTNGGVTFSSTPIVSGTTATSSTRNLTVGATYAWRARTTDSARRTGNYKASLPARVDRYQETNAAITYLGPWTSASTSTASAGAEKRASVKGATATITLTNVRQFAIVGPRSSSRGSFEVWVDGAKVGHRQRAGDDRRLQAGPVRPEPHERRRRLPHDRDPRRRQRDRQPRRHPVPFLTPGALWYSHDRGERSPMNTGFGAYLALFSETGVLLLVTTLAGVAAGYWVDQRLDTVPVFVLVGFLAGAGIGTVGIYRLITRFLKRLD